MPFKDNLRKLLKTFVLHKLRNGEKVPETALICVTQDRNELFLNDISDSEHVWDHTFILEFENYLLSESEGENNLSELNQLLEKSFKECQMLHDEIIRIIQTRVETLEKFEESVNAAKKRKALLEQNLVDKCRLILLDLSIIEEKLTIVALDLVSRMAKEQKYAIPAFKKLEDLLNSEKIKLNTKVVNLKDLRKKYDQVKEQPHFKELLIRFKKLKKDKSDLLLQGNYIGAT